MTACAHPSAEGGARTIAASDTAATIAQLRATDSSLAAAAELGDASVVVSVLEPSAAVLVPGQPLLRGSEARPALIARYGAPARYSWRPVHAVASVDGMFGCTVGYSLFVNPSDTVRAGHRGTYIACWRRAAGGWRLAGLQRSDSPGEPPADADADALAGAPHSATFSSSSDPLRDARAADSAFAVMGRAPAGPGPAFAQYAAEDGMLFSGARPRGPAGIAAVFAGFPPERVILWEPKRGFGAGSGGLAFTVGDAVSGVRSAAPGVGAHNKYLTVWRQDPDGRWRYLFDLGSSRP